MKHMILLLLVALFDFTGIATAQESIILTKDHLPQQMLPAKIPAKAETITAFRRIKPQMSMREVVEICGLPEKDIGSGIHVYVYGLADASQVRVGTPDAKQVIYVVHVLKNGEEREMIRN